jgi:anthranilate 1,2-dioxygenase small subunit
MSNAGNRNDMELKFELRDFYERYTNCLNDTDYDRWLTFFTKDANYRITSRENYARGLPLSAMSCDGKGMLQDRVTALVKVLVYEPRIWRRCVNAVRADKVEDGVIHSRADFLLYESMMDREPQLNMLGEYVDRIVREDGELRIRERVCVYDNYRIQTTLFAPV